MEKGQARKGQKRKMEKKRKDTSFARRILADPTTNRAAAGSGRPMAAAAAQRHMQEVRRGRGHGLPPGLAQGTGSADRGGAAIFTGGPTVLGTAGRPVAGVSGGAAAGAWALAGGAARSSLMAARRRARTRP